MDRPILHSLAESALGLLRRGSCRAATLGCVALVMSAPAAQAQTLPTCSSADLSGVTVLGCLGTYQGNLLGNSSAAQVTQYLQQWYPTLTTTSISSAIGTSGWTTTATEIKGDRGQALVNFAAPLSGIALVGLHEGGKGGGDTAFYLIQAGSNLDTFKFSTTAPSGAQIYAMNLTSPVPEPETYMLYLAGLAVVGFVVKRRRPAA